MLQQLRQNSRSFVIWVLFGIIIAAFVLTFGPQGDQQLGCGADKVVVMHLDGKSVDQYSWQFGNALQIRGGRKNKVTTVMDLLLQRELLAQAGESLGLDISTDLAAEQIVQGNFSVMGIRQDGKKSYYKDGVPDQKLLGRFAKALGLPSLQYFVSQQRRELLADFMRSTLSESVITAKDEVLESYKHNQNTATIDYVKYSVSAYQRNLLLNAKHIEAYIAKHESDIKKKYEDEEPQYKDRGAEVRARHIMFRKQNNPQNPTGKSDAGVEAPNPARAKAEEALASLRAGANFAELAKKLSEDARTAKQGGDLGWRPKASLGWGASLAEAAQSLEIDQISEVVETDRAFHILRVDDRREGDLTYEQVKRDIAEKLAKEHYARETARKDAETTFAQVQTGKKLKDLFERDKSTPRTPPGLTPEMLKNLPPDFLEQLKKRKSGSLFQEGPTVPTAWTGRLPFTLGAVPTTQKSPALEKAPPTAAGAESTEVELPRPTPAPVIKLRTVGPMTRHKDTIREVGKSTEAMEEIFEKLSPGQSGNKVFDVGDGFVILQLVNRQQPDLKKFEEDYPELMKTFVQQRTANVLTQWMLDRCRTLSEANLIEINPQFLTISDDKGNPVVLSYEPCASIERLVGSL